jgi:hypothetical protein
MVLDPCEDADPDYVPVVAVFGRQNSAEPLHIPVAKTAIYTNTLQVSAANPRAQVHYPLVCWDRRRATDRSPVTGQSAFAIRCNAKINATRWMTTFQALPYSFEFDIA